MTNLASQLAEGLAQLSFSLPTSVQPPLLAYVELLARWNQAYNLTAIRDKHEMISRHLLDSLVLWPHIQATKVLDVGSGAGLPGLVLAITQPEVQWVLLDSNGKKTRFMQQAVLELRLKNVTVVQHRVEHYQPESLFSQITARAYSELRLFYQQTQHLRAADGGLLAMKGVYPTEELATLADLPLKAEVVRLNVPFLTGERHLVKLCSTVA